MLLAAALPLVLFCVVSLTASVMFAVLLYIIRAKKKANAAVPMKSNHDDRERATKEIEEVYYDTIDLNASVDPQILNMEKNCAYGEIHMQNT